MQPDFYSTGALPVSGGEELVEKIEPLVKTFKNIVFTQDSHPAGHISFASSYVGKKPFEMLSLNEVSRVQSEIFSEREIREYLKKISGEAQVLWPDHCVQGSEGWKLDSRLSHQSALCILRKGLNPLVDSYSAFYENDGSSTGLVEFLRIRGISKVLVCGLAGDYCVFWTAKDAKNSGFEVYFLEQLTRYVNFPEGSKENALKVMDEIGVHRL